MKAKLIKQDNEWHLFVNHLEPKITPFAKYPWDITKQRLSLKNCQAIERGYDLDELACKEIKIDISVVKHIDEKLKENSSPCTPSKEGGCVGSNLYNQVKGFQKGFQKALELMGDKKFSDSDMERMSLATSEWENSEIEYGKDVLIRKVFKLLQQTEWDVEFNHDELDQDGCLILKPIK